MPDAGKQGLQKRSRLTDAEIAEIAQLLTLCNQQENLHLPILMDILRQRSGDEIDDFLYYEHERVVGYLSLSGWDKQEQEMTGMVAPACRRRGIFRQLFQAAYAECQTGDVEKLILICEQSSISGQAFVKTVGAQLDFSEHAMRLEALIERQQHDPQFQMRPATVEDKAALVAIMATDMDENEDPQAFVGSLYQAPGQEFYLSTLAGKPLGTLRLDYQDGAVGIYGFVVLPEYRGRGYGRQMLEEVIRRISATGSRTITLEVETTNQRAIGLYTSCGFQIVTTYDYFLCTL